MFFFLFAQARYYLPETGRFISEDSYKGTLPDIQSQNRYIYCTNNPLKYIDPSGHYVQYLHYAPTALEKISYFVQRAYSAMAPYGSQIADTVSRGYNAIGAEVPQIMNMVGNQLDKIPAVFNIGNAATQAAEKGGGSNSGGGSNNFDPNDPRWKDCFGKDDTHFRAKEFKKGKFYEKHYIKHVIDKNEWGKVLTKKEYAEKAKNLLNSKCSENIWGFTTKSGYRFRYNVKLNEFGVAKADGTIETLFRPTEGIKYFVGEFYKYGGIK